MQLQINDKYRISTDPHNYIVEERMVAGKDAKEPGAEYWVNVAYHRTLLDACQWLLNHHIKESDLKTGLEVADEVQRFSNVILTAIEKHDFALA